MLPYLAAQVAAAITHPLEQSVLDFTSLGLVPYLRHSWNSGAETWHAHPTGFNEIYVDILDYNQESLVLYLIQLGESVLLQ